MRGGSRPDRWAERPAEELVTGASLTADRGRRSGAARAQTGRGVSESGGERERFCRSASGGVHRRQEARAASARRGKGLDAAHAALPANRAALEVDPGETQHPCVDRRRLHGAGRGSVGEQLAAALELSPADAVGEEAEVADADEALGHDGASVNPARRSDRA
jgi:hypothetical protein